VKYVEAFGQLAYIIKARVQLLRDIGAALSPFNAWLLLQGIETLGLRVERHSANALRAAQALKEHPKVLWVSYPGLPGDPAYANAQKYLPKGAGAVLSFGVKGGAAAARGVIDRLQLFSLLANIGDAKSLAIHPASTTHQQLSLADQIACGVSDDGIRLSIGLESIDDILADLSNALDAA
jgi:O-acetylhomoserine (thiol)-lyase